MSADKWIWMGHAGHFILGHKCRFHLSTYVNGYIVSTVGEYVLSNDLIDVIYPEFKHLMGDEKGIRLHEEIQVRIYWCWPR